MSIQLDKGDKAPLVTEAGKVPDRIMAGVGWTAGGGGSKGRFGAFKRDRGVDLDLSVIGRDRKGDAIGGAFYDNLTAFGGALQHTGDNRTGKGDGWDETVEIDLSKMPGSVDSVCIYLSSFKGADFSKIVEAKCGLYAVEGRTEEEITELYLPIEGTSTACFIARIFRSNDAWELQHVQKLGTARTWQEMRAWRA